MKTDYLKFKRALEETGKTYFNIYDLKKFYPYNKESLKVLLSNWTKKELIYNLGSGFYAFDITDLDYLHLANSLDQGSYISFEYALSYYHLIDQVPSTITLATRKRSHKVKVANWIFEYTHLKDDLFFSYELKDKIYIATPEKAVADLIYLMARGKRIVDLDSLERSKLNQRDLGKILKRFSSYVKAKAVALGILR